jgi:hypothetical protein
LAETSANAHAQRRNLIIAPVIDAFEKPIRIARIIRKAVANRAILAPARMTLPGVETSRLQYFLHFFFESPTVSASNVWLAATLPYNQ